MIVALGVIIIIQADLFGVSAKNVEKDMRKEMKIAQDWQTIEAEDDNLCAVLAYSPEGEDYTYAVYRIGRAFPLVTFSERVAKHPI